VWRNYKKCKMARKWLDYEKEIMEAMLMERDILVVLARGLGLKSIVGKFMELYAQPTSLTLCLNASHDAEVYVDSLHAQGMSKERMPQVITNKCNAQERKLMYKSGGCIIITSRILVVDMLNHAIDISMISGLLICNAHKVTDSSVEAFILRLFREVNRNGFVKAFSDDAISFSSGFNKVEQAMKLLYLRKVLFYPRFHVSIGTCLEQHEPDVFEVEVPLTPLMMEMQQALLVATEATLNELKRSCKDLDETELTIQNALTKALDLLLKRQVLSEALGYLLTQKRLSGQQRIPSPWLFSEAADRLFTAAKKRLYELKKVKHKKTGAIDYELKVTLELNPKWESLLQVLTELEDTPMRLAGATTLVMVRDNRTASQLREIVYMGGTAMMQRRFGRYLKHKNENIVANLSSFGVEQKLLHALSATLVDENSSHDTTANSNGKRKATTSAAPSFSTASEVASYGMPLDELVHLSSQQDSKRLKPTGKLGILPPQDQLVLCTYADAEKCSNLLDDLRPSHIILYDPDVSFIRELEVYSALSSSPIQVHFMVYENSAEQQAYLTEVKREKDAFDRLIKQKEHMVIPLNVFDLPAHLKVKKPVAYSLDTRTGGRAKLHTQSNQVVVDVREFRSALPSMLHKEGLVLYPVTIEVGDYILSPRICVERKSISDLFGSLANGRLFNQADMMLRFYQVPVLLIEFSPEKPFALQVSSLFLFKLVKKGQEDPSVEAAMAAGSTASNAGLNSNAIDVLRKLPGVNDHNYRKLVASCRNLADLSSKSVQELEKWIGATCAKKLHAFFNHVAD
ncbi:hypothetical protein DYB32_003453, partial [Aphanomyces invadans]